MTDPYWWNCLVLLLIEIAIENENNHKNSPMKRKRTCLKEREQCNLCLSQESFLNAGKEADAAFEASYISDLITKAGKVIHQNPVSEDMLVFYVEYQCDIHCETCPNLLVLFLIFIIIYF